MTDIVSKLEELKDDFLAKTGLNATVACVGEKEFEEVLRTLEILEMIIGVTKFTPENGSKMHLIGLEIQPTNHKEFLRVGVLG